jgi:hypothetical protein
VLTKIPPSSTNCHSFGGSLSVILLVASNKDWDAVNMPAASLAGQFHVVFLDAERPIFIHSHKRGAHNYVCDVAATTAGLHHTGV